MPALLIASHNPDKIGEIRDLLGDLRVELHSLRDFPGAEAHGGGSGQPGWQCHEKALEGASHTGLLCLADDTGLFIRR